MNANFEKQQSVARLSIRRAFSLRDCEYYTFTCHANLLNLPMI